MTAAESRIQLETLRERDIRIRREKLRDKFYEALVGAGLVILGASIGFGAGAVYAYEYAREKYQQKQLEQPAKGWSCKQAIAQCGLELRERDPFPRKK